MFRASMLDYETTGTNLHCSLVAAGICMADMDNPEFVPLTRYYSKIKFDKSNPLKFDNPQTLLWWFKQSPEAQEAFNQKDARSLYNVLIDINAILDYHNPVEFMSKGLDFDIAMTLAKMEELDIKPSWHYRIQRCYRTREADFSLPRGDAKHNAYSDAEDQLKIWHAHYQAKAL